MEYDKLASRYVAKRLAEWSRMPGDGALRAELAQLRRGVGAAPGERPELWSMLFDGFPEELMSTNGIPTRAEWAVSIALTLYALHQQGRDPKQDPMHEEGKTLGTAVRRLANSEERLPAVRRRFNAFVTAADMPECAHYLRSLVQLLRAEGIPLDYVRLTEELYWFQTETGARRVKLRWGQDFYRMVQEEKGEFKENE